MAQIPTFQTSPGAVPSTAGVGTRANISVATPRIPVDAAVNALSQTAQAGNRLADMGFSFADKYAEAKMQVEAADQQAALSQKANDAQFKASQIPDRQQATDTYNQMMDNIWKEYSDQDNHPLIKSKVQSSFIHERQLRLAATQNASFGLESQAQRGKLITQLDGWTKQAADASDPRLRDKLIQDGKDAIDGRMHGGWLNPEAAAKLKIDFESNVYRTQMEFAFAKDMRLGLAIYNANKSKLNAADGRAMTITAEDRTKEVEAEGWVNQRLPVLGQYGNVSHWGGAIEGAAAKTGVRAPLLAAVLSEESGGNASAVSPAGARGPAQLMAGTAADLGVRNPHDPNEAIPGGATYLKQQLDRFGGDEVAALAAYNWGPANVEKWKANGADPAKLPAETRAYIQKVMAKDKLFRETAASGDSLSAYRTEALKAEQELLADDTLDPGVKSRRMAVLQQRARTTQSLVLSQREQIKDRAESASIGLFTGKYTPGTFQGIADAYRQTGDQSQADVYDMLAQNESQVMKFAQLPPGEQRTFAHILPGAAGKIAQSILADGRADRVEFRKEAARQADLFDKGIAEGVDPAALVQNARDAISYYAASGDQAQAKAVAEKFAGLVKGSQLGTLPTGMAEAELRRLREAANSSDGLDRSTAVAIQQLQRGIAKNRDTWAKDPLVGAEGSRLIKPLEPFDVQQDPGQMQLWMNGRMEQVRRAQAAVAPYSQTPVVPMFTQQEAADIKANLHRGNVQGRQQFLARLSTAIPAEQVGLVGQQLGGDQMGDVWAAAMAFYKRRNPGDVEIADSLIAGGNAWLEGGAEGRGKYKLDATTQTLIDGELGTARAGMDGRARDAQNAAIAARYVALRGKSDDGSGPADQAVLQQAIRDVVGTRARFNGVDLLLPSGVNSSQFEDGIAALQPSDLPPLQPAADGSPITAEKIRRYGSLRTMGDGIYWVYLPDPKMGGTREVRRSDTGKPYEIEIRPLIARGVSSPMNRLGVTPQGLQ